MSPLKLVPFTSNNFDLFRSWISSEEFLVTIAGTKFTFPPDDHQLQAYLDDPASHSLNVVTRSDGKIIGHAEVTLLGDKRGKLDKVLIGDENQRGKGVGQSLMIELLDYCYNNLHLEETELYVYDWNTAGIRCYEKVGFVLQPDQTLQTRFGKHNWTALLMKHKRNPRN